MEKSFAAAGVIGTKLVQTFPQMHTQLHLQAAVQTTHTHTVVPQCQETYLNVLT